MVEEFTDNDEKYQKWLAQNPNGFVVNTPRNRSTDYMVLHRATCSLIRNYTEMAQPGGFTERQYIKICSNDIKKIEEWIIDKYRAITFSKICSRCDPN